MNVEEMNSVSIEPVNCGTKQKSINKFNRRLEVAKDVQHSLLLIAGNGESNIRII